jgi:hypothetical protein
VAGREGSVCCFADSRFSDAGAREIAHGGADRFFFFGVDWWS